jgi:hypothetical protein
MVVFKCEMWTIGLALDMAIDKSETLWNHRVTMVAVITNSQAAIRQTAHLELGPGQRLAKQINRWVQSVLAHSIPTEIHSVPGHTGMSGYEEGDRQANQSRDTIGNTVIERQYTSA